MKQSILLTGGRNVQMKVWWTDNALGPYEMALVDYKRKGNPREGAFTMLRLSRAAEFWGAVQFPGKTIDLGGAGLARFVDLDNDGVPELTQWTTSEPDARFVQDPNLPLVLSERIYRRTDDGFRLLDRRTVPTPFATFVLFLRALETGQVALARSLTSAQTVYTKAQTLKLGTFHAPASWRASEPAPGSRWAESMRFQYGVPPHLDKAIDVRMKEVEGHWLVDGLTALSSGPAAVKPATKPAAPAAGTGAAGK